MIHHIVVSNACSHATFTTVHHHVMEMILVMHTFVHPGLIRLSELHEVLTVRQELWDARHKGIVSAKPYRLIPWVVYYIRYSLLPRRIILLVQTPFCTS